MDEKDPKQPPPTFPYRPFVNPPPILYKYYPPERAKDIFDIFPAFRFSHPDEFNDTFDSQVSHTNRKDGPLERIRLHAQFRRQVGIFCLTEVPDSHLMWVHYARNHTGFIIGLDSSSSFFSENGRILAPVHYGSPPVVDLRSEPKSDFCFHKSPEWREEREWRCIEMFEDHEDRLVVFGGGIIKQVIFGSKIEDSVISTLLGSMRHDTESPKPSFFWL